MRILFIEVRSKTYSYQQVAQELQKLGHEIVWLVYNHSIKPSCGSVHTIPYPSKKQLEYDQSKLNTENFKKVADSDRNVLYLKGGINHYPYYWNQISQILDTEKPDVVLGEPSPFYAVMCGLLCKEKGIPMFSESVARYPRDRFTFNPPDRYHQISSSGDKIVFEEAKQKWSEIVSRTTRPEYMDQFSRKEFHYLRIYWLYSLHRIGYYYQHLKGERYLTRSLLHNFKEKRLIKNNHVLWDQMAETSINSSEFVILYPLQYQPEYNLDVWGTQYRNQIETIRKIVANMPDGCVLYVKPNPARGLEISQDLVNFVRESKKTTAIKTNVNMSEVFNDIDMVITVTGTVAIECVFSGKPVISLAETETSRFRGCIKPDDIDAISGLIELAKKGEFPLADDDEKYRFYSHLLDSSHAGMMQDFLMVYGKLMGDDNLKKLVTGYLKLLEQLSAGRLEFNGKENSTNRQSQHS